MPRWFDPLSLRIRDAVLRHYLVPYSPFGLDAGLVDVKVCAIDEVWSGLKFVRRLADRT